MRIDLFLILLLPHLAIALLKKSEKTNLHTEDDLYRDML
jgi:hypothetical protein